MARKKGGEAEREKADLREKLSKHLDIPPDVFPGESLVEIRGRGSVTVRGGGKILAYTPEEIRIALKRGCLSVQGRRLICTSYYVGAVGIDGCICRISFEEVQS